MSSGGRSALQAAKGPEKRERASATFRGTD